MFKKVFLILFSIFLLGAIVSCGRGGDGAPPWHFRGDLTLYNDTSLSISKLYLTPANEPEWGPDQLSSDLLSGESYTITDIIPDLYDVKAVIIGNLSTYYGYIYDIPIEARHTFDLYAYNSDFSGSLEIVNHTADSYIEEIYVSPKDAGTWGPNQITSSIAPGDFIHLYDLSSGSYDVWIVWDTIPHNVYYYDNIIKSLTLLTLNAD
jgi:hypothetical protein